MAPSPPFAQTSDKATGTPFPESLEIGMVCRGHCFREGLIMRAVGDRMIIAPPLVITREQMDSALDAIEESFEDFTAGRIPDSVLETVKGW